MRFLLMILTFASCAAFGRDEVVCEYILKTRYHRNDAQELLSEVLRPGMQLKFAPIFPRSLRAKALEMVGVDPDRDWKDDPVEIVVIKGATAAEGKTELAVLDDLVGLSIKLDPLAPYFLWEPVAEDIQTFEHETKEVYGNSTYERIPPGVVGNPVGQVVRELTFGRRYLKAQRSLTDGSVTVELGLDVECDQLNRFSYSNERMYIPTEYGRLCRVPVLKAHVAGD